MSSSAEGDDAKRDDDLEHDEDRSAILQRRRKFVATALGTLVLASTAMVDCSGPQPCLSARPEDVVSDQPNRSDATPQPCLAAALDVPTFDATDAQPQPCLDMAITDVPTADG